MNDQSDVDIFWGRCSHGEGGPHHYGPHSNLKNKWRDNGTCSFCGGMRPSIALEAIKSGATVTPTDKNYKIYIEGGTVPLPSPGGKCYLNHFSESQAVEFVLLNESGKMKLHYPGHFYSGLCFGIYKDVILKAVEKYRSENPKA